jgi:diguanylate cyclase (GGDEF)-like protein/PAS domain S-box-containing protein
MSESAIDFQFLTENSVDVICRVGLDRTIHYISPACLAGYGWDPAEIVGGTMDRFIVAEDMPKIMAAIEGAMAPGKEQQTATVRIYHKNGSIVWAEGKGRIVRDVSTGGVLEFVVVWRDVSERKLLEDKLSALAMTDGLTGLANRRAFDEALEREWKRTLREGTQVSLLLLDIDHFKRFNDLYGHQVGDDCLRAVAQAALGAVRQTDLVARYGGEEIAIILPLVDTPGAVETAEKVRAAVEGLRLKHAENLEGGERLTVSIGAATAVARYGGTMRMPESLLLTADNALYKAKHAGRNCVRTGWLIAPQDLVNA